MVKTNEKNSELTPQAQQSPCLLDAAITQLKQNAAAKFVEKVDISLQTGIDARKMMVRGMAKLPHGTGKSVRVAVFATGDLAKSAEKAGAHRVGFEDLFEELKGDDWDYDVIIATPDAMAMVGKLGKKLGPKGLMPNPKLGSVTEDLKTAIKDAKSGQVEIRNDKDGNIGVSIGKKSFADDKLIKNFNAIIETLEKEKSNNTVKGELVKSAFITSTMGVSYKLKLGKSI